MSFSAPKPRGEYARDVVTLWLAAAILCLLFVPLQALLNGMAEDTAHLRLALSDAQAERLAQPSPEEVAALRAAAAEAAATEERLLGILENARQETIPWRAILPRLMPAPLSELYLTTLCQQGDTITISGTTESRPAVDRLAARLQGSLLFREVQVEATKGDDIVHFTLTLRIQRVQP